MIASLRSLSPSLFLFLSSPAGMTFVHQRLIENLIAFPGEMHYHMRGKQHHSFVRLGSEGKRGRLLWYPMPMLDVALWLCGGWLTNSHIQLWMQHFCVAQRRVNKNQTNLNKTGFHLLQPWVKIFLLLQCCFETYFWLSVLSLTFQKWYFCAEI